MVKSNRSVTALLALLALSVLPTPARAQTLTVLHNFGAVPGDPTYPREIGAIAEGQDGSMYTTSQQGGTLGRGTIFKITPDGKVTVLYNFDNIHGAGPQSGLTRGSDGNFYGTAYSGGRTGVGTIYRITPAGTFTLLHEFNASDGSYPISAPVQGKDGNFYGVTAYTDNFQLGVVYRISPGGAFAALYHFNGKDVAAVGTFASSLVAASDGNFYGTTFKGGAGYGTVYKVTPTGSISAVHVFDGTHGAQACNLIQASDGNLYGACNVGGPSNYGLVYRVTPAGQYTVLHNFVGTDGAGALAGVMQAKDGYLYGATRGGGTGGRGVIYRISMSGANFKVVHNLNANMTEGRYCVQAPFQHSSGSLYGCIWQGGTKDAGVFYRLTLSTAGLLRTPGKAGAPLHLAGLVTGDSKSSAGAVASH